MPGLRRKAVLAVLALRRGAVVSSDLLIDAVWAGAAPATAANTLQRNVSHLRLVLGDRAAITARAPGYVLSTGGEPTDVETAEELLRQAAGSPAADRVRLLGEALALWRGASLEDVGALPWLQRQAERLERLRLQARQDLLDARLALGQHAAVLPELADLAAAHPFEARIHPQLVLSLYRAGRQVEALARFRRLRARLRDELGIDPSPALHELEAAILRQESALVPDPALAPAPPPSTGPPAPAQLPPAVRGFTGRDAEVARLDGLLCPAAPNGPAAPEAPAAPAAPDAAGDRAGVPIAMISGSAGVGKTTLAIHWAHRAADRFPDGQLYVDLRGFAPGGRPMDPAQALRGFLDALAVPPARIPPDLAARAARYRSLLAGRPGAGLRPLPAHRPAGRAAAARALVRPRPAAPGAGFEPHAWRLAWTLTLVLDGRGLWSDYVATQRSALAAASRIGDLAGQAHARHGLGRAYSGLEREVEAVRHLTAALELYTALDDRAGQANACLGLGHLAERKGDDPEARRQAEAALELFRSAGHRSGEAVALNNLGWSATALGEYDRALAHGQQSLRLHQGPRRRAGPGRVVGLARPGPAPARPAPARPAPGVDHLLRHRPRPVPHVRRPGQPGRHPPPGWARCTPLSATGSPPGPAGSRPWRSWRGSAIRTPRRCATRCATGDRRPGP